MHFCKISFSFQHICIKLVWNKPALLSKTFVMLPISFSPIILAGWGMNKRWIWTDHVIHSHDSRFWKHQHVFFFLIFGHFKGHFKNMYFNRVKFVRIIPSVPNCLGQGGWGFLNNIGKVLTTFKWAVRWPHDSGPTFFSGRIKIARLNCPNTLERDHLTRQNLNEISILVASIFCFASS